MVYLNCDFCGRPALPSEHPVLLCATCLTKYDRSFCGKCGQPVMFSIDDRGLRHCLTGLCSFCVIRKRLADVPASDRDSFQSLALRSRFAAVNEIWKRLGWSIHDSKVAVQTLIEDADLK